MKNRGERGVLYITILGGGMHWVYGAVRVASFLQRFPERALW